LRQKEILNVRKNVSAKESESCDSKAYQHKDNGSGQHPLMCGMCRHENREKKVKATDSKLRRMLHHRNGQKPGGETEGPEGRNLPWIRDAHRGSIVTSWV